MEALILDWLGLGVRIFHVVAGIAWIGASFYFIWLDNSLEEPPAWKRERGVKGDLWAIHGGGFYEVAKYRLGPPAMPEKLHWFKWEAYTTYLTGTLLLVVVYYAQARVYLVVPDGVLSSPAASVAASVAFMAIGALGYEAALRTRLVNEPVPFAVGLFVWLAFAAWLAGALFAPRAAYLHVGALIGTMMVGNVFFGIIPSQKRFVAAVEAGREPDAAGAAEAKMRSVHNNYLTLPVVFCMVSHHYPFLYGHPQAWAVLVALCVALVYLRHFFNLRHRGIVRPGILVGSGAALLVIALVTSASSRAPAGVAAGNHPEPMHLVRQHCTSCHAVQPTFAGMAAPPAGLVMESLADVERLAPQMKVAIASGYMPLGNVTGLSPGDRSALIGWLDAMPR